MYRKFIVLLFLFLLIWKSIVFAKNTRDENYTIKPEIVRIIDGDTILIKTKEGTASVRLTGIDCFETYMNPHIKYQKTDDITYEEIFERGIAAKNKLESLLKEKEVYLEITGIDKKYGRLVGILYTDSMNVNKEMLKNKLCKEYIYSSVNKKVKN